MPVLDPTSLILAKPQSDETMFKFSWPLPEVTQVTLQPTPAPATPMSPALATPASPAPNETRMETLLGCAMLSPTPPLVSPVPPSPGLPQSQTVTRSGQVIRRPAEYSD